jgi:hypothetical protein
MSRVCPSCGYDQLSDQIDWCPRCNEFLAWDRDGGDTAVADSSGERATVAAPTIAPGVQAARTAGRVVLRLRGPGEETTSDLPVALSVEAGHTVSLIALVRNESEIVEHIRLSVDGLPDGWWSVEREVVRLLPFGSGEYETELAVAIHPPRTAHSRAGRWEFEVVASAVAQPLEGRAAYSRLWLSAGGGRGSTPTSATSVTHPSRSTSGRPSSRTAAASCCPP